MANTEKPLTPEQENMAAVEALKLPRASIDRIIKEALPAGLRADKDVREAYSHACSVFIMCLSAAANEAAVAAKRKTITVNDVESAVKRMGLNLQEVDDAVKRFTAAKKAQREVLQMRGTKRSAPPAGDESTPVVEEAASAPAPESMAMES